MLCMLLCTAILSWAAWLTLFSRALTMPMGLLLARLTGLLSWSPPVLVTRCRLCRVLCRGSASIRARTLVQFVLSRYRRKVLSGLV